MTTYLLKIQETLDDIYSENSPFNEKRVIKYLSSGIIWELHKAILCGEHYDGEAETKFGNIVSTVSSIESILRSPENLAPIPLTESQRSWNDINISELNKLIRIFFKLYSSTFSSLISYVSNSMSNFSIGQEGINIRTRELQGYQLFQEFSIFFSADPSIEKNVKNYNLFYANILLAYVDDSLECKEESLFLLKNVKDFLISSTVNEDEDFEIRKPLTDKAEFLEYKIHYRNSRPTKEYQLGAIKAPEIAKENVFYPLAEKIERHYTGDFSLVALNKSIEKISLESIQNGEFEIEPFHHLNRHYIKSKEANIQENKTNIESLLNKVDQLRTSWKELSIFDQIAFVSVDKLLSNSLLKLQLEENSSNQYPEIIAEIQVFLSDESAGQVKYLEDKLLYLQSVSKKDKFADYYCYVIFIKYLNQLIDYLISNPQFILISSIEKRDSQKLHQRILFLLQYIQTFYGNVLVILRQNLWGMMTHKVKPVYLSSKECTVPYEFKEENNIVERRLFIDSSYILPLNFERVVQKVQTWESFLVPQLNILKDSFEIYLNQIELKSDIELFKNEAKQTQTSVEQQIEGNEKKISDQIKENETSFLKQVKENEFKVVQIVAMFVSIATFVLSNVKIFDNKTALESFGIILGLAACFFLFNLFFYIIIVIQFQGDGQGWSAFKKMLKYLIIPVIFLTGGLYFLHSEKGKAEKSMENLNDRIDSLVKEVRPHTTLVSQYKDTDTINRADTRTRK